MTNEYNKERNTQAKRETTRTLRRLDRTEITLRELSFFNPSVVRFVIGSMMMMMLLFWWVLITWLFVRCCCVWFWIGWFWDWFWDWHWFRYRNRNCNLLFVDDWLSFLEDWNGNWKREGNSKHVLLLEE